MRSRRRKQPSASIQNSVSLYVHLIICEFIDRGCFCSFFSFRRALMDHSFGVGLLLMHTTTGDSSFSSSSFFGNENNKEGLFSRQTQIVFTLSGDPSNGNGGGTTPPSTDPPPLPRIQVCEKDPISDEEFGYCLDVNNNKYDFCWYADTNMAVCRNFAESTKFAMGFALTPWGYCEVYFDNTDSKTRVQNLCPPGMNAGSSENTGTGYPVGLEGGSDIPCFSCRQPSKQDCSKSTFEDWTGFCLDSVGITYPFCSRGDVPTEDYCRLGAEGTDKSVGYSYTPWGYCEIYFDSTVVGTKLADFCPKGFNSCGCSNKGTGFPGALQGKENNGVTCNTCATPRKPPPPGDCRFRVSLKNGFCLDKVSGGQKYDFCFGLNWQREDCLKVAQTTYKIRGLPSIPVGWGYSAQGKYCEVYFDNKDSGTNVGEICPPGLYPGKSDSTAVGPPRGIDGSGDAFCYSCSGLVPPPSPRACGTRVTGNGYCQDNSNRAYDYCFNSSNAATCKAAAENHALVVGWSITNWNECRLHFDNMDTLDKVDGFCPPGFFSGSADGQGTAFPTKVDGNAGAQCYTCAGS